MLRTDFSFELPEQLIARYPQPERSASRLLKLNRHTGELSHQHFTDILAAFNAGDLLVFNNTRVIPARLFGQKASGGKVEVLVERILDTKRFLAHVRASKAPKAGNLLMLENDAELVAKRPEGIRVEDIAALLGHETSHVADLLSMAEAPRSLDAALDRSDGDQTLGDGLVDEMAVAPEDVTLSHEVELLLEEWISTLTPREREVLEGRFGLHNHEPETLDTLSLRLGLTRERVRQVQNEALLKLKRYLGRRGITRQSVI